MRVSESFYSCFDATYVFANSLTVDPIICKHASWQMVIASSGSC